MKLKQLKHAKNINMYILLLVFMFLLPFDALPIYFLGQGGYEGALYPGLVLSFVSILIILVQVMTKGKLIVFDKTVFYIILFFLIGVIFSLLINIENIMVAFHMNKMGLSRYLGQCVQLLVGFSLVYIMMQIINTENRLYKLIKYINIFMIVFILFGLFQFLAYEVQGVFLSVYKTIGSYIYHDSIIPFALERRHALHSLTQEPSFLSMYIGVIGPFVIAYGLIQKKIVVVFLMIGIVLMSLSRTGYVIMLFEILLFSYFKYFKYFRLHFIVLFFISSSIIVGILISFTPVGDIVLSLFNVESNGSNAARYAAAFSAIQVWWHNNLLFGVGLGQTGFYSIEYLPAWGYLSNDVWDTFNEKRWPPIHNLLIRILAETGIIGLFLWLSIYLYLLMKIHKIIYIKYRYYREQDYIGYAVFISLCGVLLTMFTRELFTNMLIWTSLGIAVAYVNIYKGIINDKKKSC